MGTNTMKKFHQYTITLSDTFKIHATSESEARAEALQLYAEKYKPRDWVWKNGVGCNLPLLIKTA